MKRCLPVLFALAVAVVLLPASAHAHFQLVEPPPWIVMNALGDPQKVGPCGGNPNGDNSEILSGIVTEVTGGSKLAPEDPGDDLPLRSLPGGALGELPQRAAGGSDRGRGSTRTGASTRSGA